MSHYRAVPMMRILTTHFKKLTTKTTCLLLSQLLSKVTVASCSFYIKLFNVSALLLDDVLLQCVVTKVVLFSVVAFKTLTFHKVV